jgi:hypothetical protein
MSKISDVAANDMDTNPTIRPVLDLSSIKKDSGLIGGMLTPKTLDLDTSYSGAANILASNRSKDTVLGSSGVVTPASVTNYYTQNNNSPKALSEAELYRQTKNLISTKKGELTTSANRS